MVDLTDCDRELVHIPGTIQSFGVLFAVDEEMKVAQVSENVTDHLSLRVDDVLGDPVGEQQQPRAWIRPARTRCGRCCANSAGSTRTR